MTWGASDTVILERPGPDGADREPPHILRARACDASFRPVFEGTADQQVTLALRSGGLGASFCLMGEGHPVDPAFPMDRLIARDAGDEINEHHHAARRGLCLSVHGAFVAQVEASVFKTRQENVS